MGYTEVFRENGWKGVPCMYMCISSGRFHSDGMLEMA